MTEPITADWVSDDCTESATYSSLLECVVYTQPQTNDDGSPGWATVHIDREAALGIVWVLLRGRADDRQAR